jgi:hypothetical protein
MKSQAISEDVLRSIRERGERSGLEQLRAAIVALSRRQLGVGHLASACHVNPDRLLAWARGDGEISEAAIAALTTQLFAGRRWDAESDRLIATGTVQTLPANSPVRAA